MVGVLELGIIALVIGLNVAWLAALVGAAMFDREVWSAAGRDKTTWILCIALFGALAAPIYLLSVRRQLQRAAAQN
ncbi:MAG: hypothetical protein AAGA54_32680 [Myxococcota bacterium]